MNEQELNATLEQMDQEENNKTHVKHELPFLYTARGNLIKPRGGAVRVSGKNAAKLLTLVGNLREHQNGYVIYMDGYYVTISIGLADRIRKADLLAEIILTGYDIRAI